MLKKIIFSLIMVILLISCGQPPEGTQEVNLLKFIYDQLVRLDEIRNDKLKQRDYFKNMMDNFNALFVFKNGSLLIINSQEAVPDETTIAYTLKNNQIKINKSLYITNENKEMVISFDKVNWYSTKSDAKKNIEAIKNNYTFNPVYDDALRLSVNYKMAFSLGDNPVKVTINKNKNYAELKKGMIFSNKDEKLINIDLTKTVLYVPQNTVIYGSLKTQGNLIESYTTKDGVVSIKSMMDIFIYFNNMRLSMSFDKSKWDVSVLSFEIDPVFNIKAVEDNKIFFDINTTAIYDENKKSLSVVKLLLRNM